ncbi:Heparan-sulfate 6-O-sulfotransferase, partial [Trichostrongylus colubriformis]
MLRRQDNRVNATIFPRRLILFVLVIFCAPAVYFLIGSPGNQFQYLDYTSSTSDTERPETHRNGVSVLGNVKPVISVRAEDSPSWDTSFSHLIDNPEHGFTIAGNDVLVFVHIQKTAGTSFEKFLVRHLNIEVPCQCSKGKKRCTCLRPNKRNEVWLFSRYSTGWLCGLHADFTELYVSGCVDRMLNKKE